jgi:hypothetical protein
MYMLVKLLHYSEYFLVLLWIVFVSSLVELAVQVATQQHPLLRVACRLLEGFGSALLCLRDRCRDF